MVKEVWIDDVLFGYTSGASMKEESDSDVIDTFQGAVSSTNPNPSVVVSIEAVRAGNVQQYIDLQKKLEYAKNNPVTIQLLLEDEGLDGKIIEKEFAYNCLKTSNETEADPVKATTYKIEFTGSNKKKFINGEEIKG
jgi:hypothetical protein